MMPQIWEKIHITNNLIKLEIHILITQNNQKNPKYLKKTHFHHCLRWRARIGPPFSLTRGRRRWKASWTWPYISSFYLQGSLICHRFISYLLMDSIMHKIHHWFCWRPFMNLIVSSYPYACLENVARKKI